MSFDVPQTKRIAFRITIRRAQVSTRSFKTLLLKKQSLIARIRQRSAFSASAVSCSDKRNRSVFCFAKSCSKSSAAAYRPFALVVTGQLFKVGSPDSPTHIN